ncbi:glucose 1-dehydrogenase [Cnuibacter physcomitrellae]|uniref:SDR family NAD(P)-dependent oxidoreductase n=1 Tax=Cnuibacter physcomitrellae TaxID=1619308 RepID=UPI002175E344|nr:glucose 1-dehydrogenase [Cnuibacter physcomitrellae]MCS5497692.1 glucose 1-dehydrogenase [Cnuibacter physcomitrellae]
MTNRMEGKVAVVTGGASGMGFGIAQALADEGARVVIVDRDGEAAERAAAAIGAESALGVRADVSSRDDVHAAVESAVSAFGRIDVWFNNAGFNRPLPFLEVTEDNFRSIMEVNALGTLIGMQEVAKQFIAQGGGGKIINTASMAGRQGFPAFAPYSASKAAVISLTQAAARGLAEHDITVNAFAPGVVDTPLWAKLNQDLFEIGEATAPDTAMDDFAAGIIRGRTAQVADIVGTALYLASGDSDYLTGQVIMIDGGMVLV